MKTIDILPGNLKLDYKVYSEMYNYTNFVYPKKVGKSIIFLLFLLLITINSFAQAPFTTISTPFGKRTINEPMRFPTYNNNKAGFINKKHYFTVVLLNDSTFEVRGEININDSVKSLTWGKGEKQKTILPSETKEIYRTSFPKTIRGIPRDSCWIFLVKKGKISTYSVSSDIETPMINYIQKDEGEIVLLDPTALEGMVSDNEKALELIRKGDFLKAIEKYNKN